jgi:chromosome segregation ATPase
MTTEHDKAVALAEKVGAPPGFIAAMQLRQAHVEWIPAMLAERDKQHTEELAQRSGVMPVVMCVAGDLQDDVPVITEARVREAIASLEAKLEQRDAEIQRQYDCITSHNKITREAEAKLEYIDREAIRMASEKAEAVLRAEILEERYESANRMRNAALSDLEQSEERMRELENFVSEVAKQKPEKPDYWSSCSQCERNASNAEELIDAAIKKESEK